MCHLFEKVNRYIILRVRLVSLKTRCKFEFFAPSDLGSLNCLNSVENMNPSFVIFDIIICLMCIVMTIAAIVKCLTVICNPVYRHFLDSYNISAIGRSIYLHNTTHASDVEIAMISM